MIALVERPEHSTAPNTSMRMRNNSFPAGGPGSRPAERAALLAAADAALAKTLSPNSVEFLDLYRQRTGE